MGRAELRVALAALLLTAAPPVEAQRRPVAEGATTIPWAVDRPPGEITTRLIAAAPSLLAACEAAHDAMQPEPGQSMLTRASGKIRDRLQEAIAKAKGGTP